MRAILTYHSIDESGSPISIDPRVFRIHVSFLAAGRPRVVPLADIASPTAPDDAVALTFDDGFQNFRDIAAPLLAELGLPATVFVVSDHVGGKNNWASAARGSSHPVPTLPLMSWDALGVLAQHGVEIGAHSRRHPRLTAVSAQVLAEEVSGGADRIAAALGVRPTSFAYPYDDLDHAVVSAVGATYRRACTTELRALAPDDESMRLPRLDAYYFRATGQLEQWGTTAFQRRMWLRAQARRVRHLVTTAAGRV